MITLTPTGTMTINATGGAAGQTVALYITTSGTSGYVVTFGTNLKSTGQVNTGVTSGKVWVVNFVCKDGTEWCETNRTTSM